ncbi:MAG: tryptophan synthase subunit alpha [Deltaproteobacteria bacterium]|nr:tryptophan synthase subunit alpha [Deltaproteobacteria bacterium]
MNRIGSRFQALRERGDKALVLYLTAGDPSLGKTAEIIPALEDSGADLLEIGVPFSDPTADGPIIQAASRRALANGTTLKAILDLIARLRPRTEIPLVLFSYYNPIWIYGPERFTQDAKAAGVDGVLVVDLPLEEAGELRRYTDPAGLDFISLVAPTTGAERLGEIAARARGFLYYISIVGITGTAGPELASLRSAVARIRKITGLPLVVGFGLSNPEQVRAAAASTDGVVVGSALVQRIHELRQREDLIRRVSVYVRRLKRALKDPDHP